jgi:cellulose synthase/poly-beta-1,6-N-acetylglucosamine synthase-like glycosyltransferase
VRAPSPPARRSPAQAATPSPSSLIAPAGPAPAQAPARQTVPGPAPAEPARETRRLGERLVTAGVIDDHQLAAALRRQRVTGDRLGAILTSSGVAREHEVVEALADQFHLRRIPAAELEPTAAAVTMLSERTMRDRRLVPLEVTQLGLRVASSQLLTDPDLELLSAEAGMPVYAELAADADLDDALQRIHAREGVRLSIEHLLTSRPEESAFQVLSRGQRVVLIGLAITAVCALAWNWLATMIAFNIFSISFYSWSIAYRFRLVFRAFGEDHELLVTQEELDSIDERTLPTYTILVPLYKEAAVLPRLVESLHEMDYPATKLDIRFLLEEDDIESREVITAMDLPPQFRIVIVPDAQPKTKPKACNYGLLQARGDYVVIYDAEDRPEPDQLKKVAIGFAKAAEDVRCIQCKLSYYNRSQNMLTEWFTTEYAMWFDLFLPALDASGVAIPLGGTSNHFVTSSLLDLCGWDPHNVTEDADLGIRLAKAGMRTAVIDSTTFEEANSAVDNWIRQRSRWVKGYIQTWLVHMRHPLRLLRQLGPRRWMSFQLVVGGTFLTFLLNPIYWLLSTIWILTEAGVIRSAFPSFVYYAAATGLTIGNFSFAYLNVAGSMRRGHYDLVRSALFSPVYWMLMSVAAWKGCLQLFYKPFYWEKTVHGLDADHEDQPVSS